MFEGGLILEIQAAAIAKDVNVSNLLRKAKVAAVKLNQRDLVAWIDAEIDGYQCSFNELPEYRKTRGTLKVQNPFSGLIPVIISDQKSEELLT